MTADRLQPQKRYMDEVLRDSPYALLLLDDMGAARNMRTTGNGVRSGTHAVGDSIIPRMQGSRLTGSASNINLSALAAFGGLIGSGFTIEMWIRHLSATNSGNIYIGSNSGSMLLQLTYRDNNTGNASNRVYLRNTAGTLLQPICGLSPPLNVWTHSVIVFDTSKMIAYRNARQVANTAAVMSGTYASMTANHRIGNTSLSPDMEIAGFALYTYPMPANRVAAHYLAAVNPPRKTVVGGGIATSPLGSRIVNSRVIVSRAA